MTLKALTALFLFQLLSTINCCEKEDRQALSLIDFDADGFLNQEEFCSPENGLDRDKDCPEAFKAADFNLDTLLSCQELVVFVYTEDSYMDPFRKSIRKVFAKKGDDCEAFSRDELMNMLLRDDSEELTTKVVELIIQEYDEDNNARISCKGNYLS